MIQLLKRKVLNVNIYIYLLFIILSALFILYPQIDIAIAKLFYDGSSFSANGSVVEEFFYYSVKPLIITMILFSLAIYIYNLIKKTAILKIDTKVIIYLILTLSLAPGLIVNVTLKENWGRARPAQIEEFGGDKIFTPAFIISNQDGYSFSSGHSAAAFSLIGFVLLARRRKRTWMRLAVMYGVSVSAARMAAGGHFLSDTLTSFFIVWITTHILYLLIFKKNSDV